MAAPENNGWNAEDLFTQENLPSTDPYPSEPSPTPGVSNDPAFNEFANTVGKIAAGVIGCLIVLIIVALLFKLLVNIVW